MSDPDYIDHWPETPDEVEDDDHALVMDFGDIKVWLDPEPEDVP